MGLAKLNIWISALDNPCKISSKRWFVNIFTCDGSPLIWCNKEYVGIGTDKCGHLEVEVPPGCYYINAVEAWYIKDGVYYGNHYTHNAIVQARCDEVVCVRLFASSLHRCGVIFAKAVQNAININRDLVQIAEPLIDNISRFLEYVPKPVAPFELDPTVEKKIESILKEEQK